MDDGALRPIGNVVARALLRKIGLRHEIISRYDGGEKPAPASALDLVWQQIKALPSDHQGALRLVVGLTHEGEIDWYLAEFFILWARQQGLSERDICQCFGIAVNDG